MLTDLPLPIGDLLAVLIVGAFATVIGMSASQNLKLGMVVAAVSEFCFGFVALGLTLYGSIGHPIRFAGVVLIGALYVLAARAAYLKHRRQAFKNR